LNEKTIIMFMSDNGPAVINNLLSDRDRKIRYVNRMKGHKGNIWENGVRSPLFVKWQGVTKPTVLYNLVDVTDIFPTIVKMAGAELPKGAKEIDGLAFCDIISCVSFEGQDKISFNYANRGWPPTNMPWSPEGTLDEYRPITLESKENERYTDQIISVRKGAFKLMHNPGKVEGGPEPEEGYVLIEILSDHHEENNLYKEMPEVAEELVALLEEWWQSILDEPASFSMPTFLIDLDEEESSFIPAYAPMKTSAGVTSAFAWLTNWKNIGDFAEYSIDIATPGLYLISVHYEGKPNGAAVKVSVNNSHVQNNIELYDKALLGSINLEAGKNILRLELMENPSGNNVFSKLEGIELKRRD
jgi:uncharacterized sulfatase